MKACIKNMHDFFFHERKSLQELITTHVTCLVAGQAFLCHQGKEIPHPGSMMVTMRTAGF